MFLNRALLSARYGAHHGGTVVKSAELAFDARQLSVGVTPCVRRAVKGARDFGQFNPKIAPHAESGGGAIEEQAGRRLFSIQMLDRSSAGVRRCFT